MAQKAVREVQVPRASSGFVPRFYVEKNKMMFVLFFWFSPTTLFNWTTKEKKSFDALDHHPSLLKYIYWIFLYIFLFEGS